MKLIMLGAPGAGKGTQASLLAGLYDIPHISTGDIFRDNIKRGTPIGKEVKLIIDAGALVPDDLTISLVKERLKREDCLKGYLLDGFPRNLYQAESLESVAPPDMAVNVDIDQDILVSRLAGRRACPNCAGTYHVSAVPSELCPVCGVKLTVRPDDVPETIRKRLEVYNSQTAPLIAFYGQLGKLLTIDGNQSIEKVCGDIVEGLRKE
ncbi:MAG: adenylate kinase [Christensenellaceae bacterium]|jgi:adenylate kinases|nr:adenylate kinase [Christensenellaceae bacterium]MBS6563885.1 adenylate kinase [Clostridiales bacterium]PWM00583.1 MAG: adenylate kinase [Selenomonadales bacterium]